MAAMYAAQQEVIVALTEVGEVERSFAVHLPICRVRMVPSTVDPIMVVRHVRWSAEQLRGAFPSSHSARRLACQTLYAQLRHQLRNVRIRWRGAGIDGATCAHWHGRR